MKKGGAKRSDYKYFKNQCLSEIIIDNIKGGRIHTNEYQDKHCNPKRKQACA